MILGEFPGGRRQLPSLLSDGGRLLLRATGDESDHDRVVPGQPFSSEAFTDQNRKSGTESGFS